MPTHVVKPNQPTMKATAPNFGSHSKRDLKATFKRCYHICGARLGELSPASEEPRAREGLLPCSGSPDMKS